MKRTTILAAMALAVYQPGVDAQNPLKIYCSSPTQEYCMSFLTWEYTLVFDVGPDPDAVFATWSTQFLAYGSGYASGPVTAQILARLTPDDWSIAMFDSETIDGPGYYGFSDSGPGSRDASLPDDGPSTPEDIRVLVFATGPNAVGCSPQGPIEGWSACVEVPEPTAWLLVASGLFGLGVVRRRRFAA